MFKKIVVSLVVLSIASLILVKFLKNKNNNQENKNKVKSVALYQVQKKNLALYKEYSGKVKGENEIDLAPKIAGRITKIYKHPGDYVNQGEIIAQIDGNELKINAKSAGESYENAREVQEDTEEYYEELVEDAKENYKNAKEKYKDLKESPTADNAEIKEAKDELEHSEEAYESAKELKDLQEQISQGELIQAKNNLNLAKEKAQDSRLRAPFTGIVINKYLEAGDLVNPQKPIVSLAKSDKQEIVFEVEGDLKPAVNQEIEIQKKHTQCKALIRLITPSLNQNTQKQKIKALPREDSNCGLKIGELVTVKVFQDSGLSSLAIPLEAVVKFYHDDTVFVVKNAQAKRIRIETGRIAEDLIEVKKGLQAGDQIVIEGQFYLKDKDKVKINEK